MTISVFIAACAVILASFFSIANIVIGICQKWFDRRDAGWDRAIKDWREIVDSVWYESTVSKDDTIRKQKDRPDIRLRRTRDKEYKGQALFFYFASKILSLAGAKRNFQEEFTSIDEFLKSKTFLFFKIVSRDYLLNYFVCLDNLLNQISTQKGRQKTKYHMVDRIVSRLSLCEAVVLQAFALSGSDLAKSLKRHIERYNLLRMLPEDAIVVQEEPEEFGGERGTSKINYRDIYKESAFKKI